MIIDKMIRDNLRAKGPPCHECPTHGNLWCSKPAVLLRVILLLNTITNINIKTSITMK